MYYLSCYKLISEKVNITKNNKSTIVWHQRYGHLNSTSLKKLVDDQLVKGIKPTDISDKIELCESCVQGKMHRTSFPKGGASRASAPLELVHSDVCGKINSKSLNNGEYFLTFVDDKTRYVWVYILKYKSQVFKCFLEWKAMVERSTKHKLITLRTDNGGEYTSHEFQSYLTQEGIKHELTVPRTPEQNGVAERLNRTLVEAVRSMLIGANLPQQFWAEALATAVYLRNRSLTKVCNLTPYEAWHGNKPSVNHLKVFGCTAYAHISKEERKKLDAKAKKCILMGYGTCVKGYRLYNPVEKKIIYSRDVVFDENTFGLRTDNEMNHKDASEMIKLITFDTPHDDSNHIPVEEDEHEALPNVEEEPAPVPAPVPAPIPGVPVAALVPVPVRRSTRERRRPDLYGVWVNNTQANEYQEPTTYKEVLISPDKDKWMEAMEVEMSSLKSNNVYDLVQLPEDRKVVGSKWVYKRKTKADGSIDRYKARLVAQGFSQRLGQDYEETFSPVIRFESIRSIIATAVNQNMMIHQMDVTSAFLNGDLEEDVYMSQPEGFIVKGKENFVYKLKRSLYGLKQAPRCWNTTLDNQLKKMGFEQTKSDPCLYISREGGLFILAVYVDNIILATKSQQRMDEVKGQLSNEFDVKDLGELKYILGVSVIQNHEDNSIWIGQPTYTMNIIDKFGLKDAKSVATPVVVGTKLTKAKEGDEIFDIELYQSAVGSLQYLSMMTRPDITFAVSNVAKYCSKPTQEHWVAVKRIFRYLNGTPDYGLLYNSGNSAECIGFSDSDWAGDSDDRKSTSGYVFQINGTAITWRSRKQSCVALSTAEAEYVALSQAAQEAVWLRQLNFDLKGEQSKPTTVYEDNQAAISLSKNPTSHGKSKHIEIKYHYIREQIQKKQIELKYCDTNNMIADMLTKGLPKDKMKKLAKLAGMAQQPSIK